MKQISQKTIVKQIKTIEVKTFEIKYKLIKI